MTNEQLAVFLRQLAKRIEILAGEVEATIHSGERESRRVWVGEGEPPAFDFGTEGWEWRPGGGDIRR